MKLLKTIENVMGFFSSENDILVTYNSSIRCYDFEYNLVWEIEMPGRIVKCLISKSKAYLEFIDKESGFEKTNVIDIKNGNSVLTDLNDYMIRSVSVDGEAIALKYNSDYSTNTFFIRLRSEKVVWEKELSVLPIFTNGTLLFSGLKNLVFAFNRDGSELWRYDLSHLGSWIDYDKKEKVIEVSRILGVFEDRVYVYLNNGKVLVLNLKTGEKITVLENDKNTDQGSFKGMFMDAIELDRNSGKLIQLFNQRYTEVVINTNSVSQSYIEEMKSLRLENMSRFAFDNEHIFFTDKNHQKLGSLNRSTLKIDWTYDLSEVEINESAGQRFGRELNLKNDRLYVLDNKNTLHVFENELAYPA